MRGKDLIAATLFGGAGGSSGGGSGTGGGGSAAVSPKEVNFYDYDGTCVHAYTVAEAQALSELPAGPEHPGLVFQGWNWSLEGVKGLSRAMNIGAMYTTDDGTTRLYITLQEGRTSPMLGVGVNGTVTVDWGDGTEPDVLIGAGTNTTKWTPNHSYDAPGDYVIRLTVDGEMAFVGSSSTNAYASILRHSSTTDVRNLVYQNALKRVEIGSGVTSISVSAFHYCYSLTHVTIPTNVTKIYNNVFNSCYALSSVTIPDGVTSIGDSLFSSCYALKSVAIPESVTSVGIAAFGNCRSIPSVTLPDGVSSITTSMFNDCFVLTHMPIPNGVKSIGNNAFNNCYHLETTKIPEGVTSIGGSAFQQCRSLTSVVCLGDVTRIESSAFYGCISVAYYDFTACTAVPALENSGIFSSIPADCEIRVPAALYDEWIAETNWATYASKIKAY